MEKRPGRIPRPHSSARRWLQSSVNLALALLDSDVMSDGMTRTGMTARLQPARAYRHGKSPIGVESRKVTPLVDDDAALGGGSGTPSFECVFFMGEICRCHWGSRSSSRAGCQQSQQRNREK